MLPVSAQLALVTFVGVIAVVACAPAGEPRRVDDDARAPGAVWSLPTPAEPAPDSLEEAIDARRSVREFRDDPLSEVEVGQLVWAAQGITDPSGKRAAPSAGATYPLEVYVVSAEGVARYRPGSHSLVVVDGADRRRALAAAALGQQAVADAPVVLVLTGVVERTAVRYGDRAERYVLLEAGHAAQNVLLQAAVLDLAAVPIGAFDDDRLVRILDLPAGERPLYLVAVGHPAPRAPGR